MKKKDIQRQNEVDYKCLYGFLCSKAVKIKASSHLLLPKYLRHHFTNKQHVKQADHLPLPNNL